MRVVDIKEQLRARVRANAAAAAAIPWPRGVGALSASRRRGPRRRLARRGRREPSLGSDSEWGFLLTRIHVHGRRAGLADQRPEGGAADPVGGGHPA